MGNPEIFSIKRCIIQERFDPHYHRPYFRRLVQRIRTKPFKRLGEIISQSSEVWGADSGLHQNTFPYIEISAVGLGNNEYFVEIIPKKDAPSRARQVVRSGDILVSLTRPHRGAIAQVKKEHDGAIASTGFAVLRDLKSSSVDRDYLFNILCTNICLDQFLQRSSGGNYPAITPDQLDKVLIPLPEEAQQKEFAKKLQFARSQQKAQFSQADELLAGMDEFVLKTLQLSIPDYSKPKCFARKSENVNGSRIDPHFHSPFFERLLENIEASPIQKIPLGRLVQDIVGGATPTKGDSELYDTKGVKFLRILNIKPNEIYLNDVKYIQLHVHNGDLLRSQLQINDVLMTITGRVGTAAVITEEILPANINQHIVRLRITGDKCKPDYLAAYLNSSVGLALTNRGTSGGTRIAVDYPWIASLPIPLPSPGVQGEIIQEIKRIQKECLRFRDGANREWESAKQWFEEQLLKGAE